MKCGLLGRKLGHSYSPQIHSLLGNYSYELFEAEPEELSDFLRNGDFDGINVTIPYKKAVIPYLDALTPTAEKLGAVNTIVRRNGKLIGHNTDYFGFQTLLGSTGLAVAGRKVLVLGSGGASNTAVAVLEELGAKVVVISRNGDHHYGNLWNHADASLIVNTTPVGMYPNTGVSPLDPLVFPDLEGILDVVYNPARTELLLQAGKLGLKSANGLLMLVAQAAEASQWFTGLPVLPEKIDEIHQRLRIQMENIVLIGMPGCGKSTVGKALSEKMGRKFADTDVWVENQYKRTVPDIIRQDGIDAFRAMETEAMKTLGKESGLVIATGGGCVTVDANYNHLHQNGTVFWLRRDLDKLPTDGRPLSQTNSLSDMYATRKPLYEVFADHVIDNNGDLKDTVAAITEIL